MDNILLTYEPLDLNTISNWVGDDSCGATSYFIGSTRDNFEAKKVQSLEYESYEPMALKEIKKICDELRSRWTDIFRIVIHHRLGLVNVGENSVIIAISSPHRQTAIDATSQAIENLKRRVPIWKKEKYFDCETSWKENKECAWLDTDKKENLLSQIECSSCSIGNIKSDFTNFVQISVPEIEVDHRIQSFVIKKRKEIDLNNTKDFIAPVSDLDFTSESSLSCARTKSLIFKREKCKGHLKVRRERNLSGPQTQPEYMQALDRHMLSLQNKINHVTQNQIRISSNERINNLENFLHIPSKNSFYIHNRIKAIENRLMFLESLSPEYVNFLGTFRNNELKSRYKTIKTPSIKKYYTIQQLDDIIHNYKNID